jgi:hypothetical protein
VLKKHLKQAPEPWQTAHSSFSIVHVLLCLINSQEKAAEQVTYLEKMIAYYDTTTHLHELPGPESSKRVLSYIVLGHPLDAADPPEQTIIYHHGKCRGPSSRHQVSLHCSSSSKQQFLYCEVCVRRDGPYNNRCIAARC